RGKVLKAARQRKSKIQPVEGIISLQAIKRKMNLLQDVVEAQADFIDRMKEVNNEGTLKNSKRIKMKHKATQESTKSKQISLTPTIERTESGYKSKHPNREAEPECKSKYPNRDRKDSNTTNGGRYSARD
ncbi:17177_t:CDS:2, partial [Gigaspora margarita]